jgi:hypothetical protein
MSPPRLYVNVKPIPTPSDAKAAFPLKRWVGDNFIYEIDGLLAEGKLLELQQLVSMKNPSVFLPVFQTLVSDSYKPLMQSLESRTLGFRFSVIGKESILCALRYSIFERVFYHLYQKRSDGAERVWVGEQYLAFKKDKQALQKQLLNMGEVENDFVQGKLMYHQERIIGVSAVHKEITAYFNKKFAGNAVLGTLVFALLFADDSILLNLPKITLLIVVISAIYLIGIKYVASQQVGVHLDQEWLQRSNLEESAVNNNFSLDIMHSNADEQHPFLQTCLEECQTITPLSPYMSLTLQGPGTPLPLPRFRND